VILLDTDHVTLLRMPRSARRDYLVARLETVGEEVGVAVVTVEEQMRGWMAAIAKERRPIRQVEPYRELAALFDFFADYDIAPFDEAAVAIFETFGRIRIGTRDRKIAATALANNALLLTANRRDFEQIPGLRFENWMDAPPAP
jgi:tRNA(fMet)-specific endonuclease VapC